MCWKKSIKFWCSIKFSICFTRGASRLLLLLQATEIGISCYQQYQWCVTLDCKDQTQCTFKYFKFVLIDIHLISITNNSVSHAFCCEKILPILFSFIIMSFGMWCFFTRAGHGVKDRMPCYQLLLMALQRY